MPTETTSVLPALTVIVPAGAAVLVFAGGRSGRYVKEVLSLVGLAATTALSLSVAWSAVRGDVLVSFGRQLYADALSGLLVSVVSVVGLLAGVYSCRYMRHEVGGSDPSAEGRLNSYYGWTLLFVATMLWACLSNNIIMLYVAVEASTIASGLLVAFYWDRRALEAGYKYLMLLTVGITFSLFGCVLVYTAGANMLGGPRGLLISDLRSVASQFPAATVALASAFLIVGFGTKAGIAPFHPWLPDAHAEAPTPISALLSGVMLKVAAYALVRTISLFYPQFSPVALFALGLGMFTLILGDLMALAQDDLKRMLAYSSVSQMGYVLMGFGIGTQLGIYGGLFHLVNHALGKALLFLAAGAIMYGTGARAISSLGGLARRMPVTSFCFFVGALALSGVPPFSGFQSKLALLVAGAEAGLWWAVVIGIGMSLITLVVLVKAARLVFWGQPNPDSPALRAREAPFSVCAVMVVLALASLGIGLYPQALYRPLSTATASLQTVPGAKGTVVAAGERSGQCTNGNLLVGSLYGSGRRQPGPAMRR